LTYTIPKPIIPLLNKPMITHIMDRLPDEIDRVILAVNYKREMLGEFFDKHGDNYRQEIVLVEEREPLGTGGAIKNCQNEITDTFIVINGDVINSLDTGKIVSDHRSRSGIGTLAVWEVPDPSRFGIIGFDGEYRITRFLEKPKPEEIFSHFINAGTYVLEPEILDHIESGRKVSIEREVYPFILGKGLFAFPFEGYWVDAGTRKDYLKAQRKIMEFEKYGITRGSECIIHPDAKLLPPVLIGSGCSISNSVIGPNAVLGDGIKIEKDVRIVDSSLLNGVHALKGTVISESIIGNDIVIGEKEVVEDMILGEPCPEHPSE